MGRWLLQMGEASRAPIWFISRSIGCRKTNFVGHTMLTRVAFLAAAAFAASQYTYCVEAASSSSDGGFATGAWKQVNTSSYTIRSPCEHQQWTITQDTASAVWLHFSSVNLTTGAHLVVASVNGSKAITVRSLSSDVTTTPISGTGVVIQYVPPSKDAQPAALRR